MSARWMTAARPLGTRRSPRGAPSPKGCKSVGQQRLARGCIDRSIRVRSPVSFLYLTRRERITLSHNLDRDARAVRPSEAAIALARLAHSRFPGPGVWFAFSANEAL